SASASLRSRRVRTSASVRSRRARNRHAASNASARRCSGVAGSGSLPGRPHSSSAAASSSDRFAGRPGAAAVSAASAPCGVLLPFMPLGGADEGCGGRRVALDRLDEVLVDPQDFVDLGLDLLRNLLVLVEVVLGVVATLAEPLVAVGEERAGLRDD